MSKLESIMLAVNERYHEAQKQGIEINEREMTREFLLSLHTFGIDNQQIKIALVGALNDKTANPFVMPWKRLQQAIYEKYMLDIGTQEKPDIKPCFGCWLNVYTRQISTVKPIDLNDFFYRDSPHHSENIDDCIWIEDYRIIGDIDWKDIAEE